MIAALARASGLLDHPDWLMLAANSYRFVCESMADGEGLAHSDRAGRLIKPGFALDHASMIDAALALHDATFEQHYLDDARCWSAHLERHYRSPESGLLGMTRLKNNDLPVIPRPTHDDAVPNANGGQAATCSASPSRPGRPKTATGPTMFCHKP